MILPFFGVVVYFWVRGLDYMHKNHPDYKGYDFLCLEDEDCEE